MLQEERRNVRNCVGLVPAVQLGLNTAFRKRYAITPYHVVLDQEALWKKVPSIAEAREELHKKVAQRIELNREL